MGTLFRLLVFIIALGALGTGTAWLLARERQREAAREFLLTAATEMDFGSRVAALDRQRASAEYDLLLFGALAASCLLVVAVVPARIAAAPAPASHGTEKVPLQREMTGLESLARTTVTQRAELDQEREARHRSEQDLYLQQVLTNGALQEKIRLGRDLHDGLVQSLYATGLMLESASRLVAEDPAQASSVLVAAKSNLKTSIKDTRAVIDGLSPDALESQNLGDSIQALLDHLDANRLEHRGVTLSPDLPVLSKRVVTELLQIIRESVSNALRHGQANRIDLAIAPSPTGLNLVIRDNGCGFDPATVNRGHGLDNLSARSRLLGGHLVVDSTPGLGTCVNLSLPLPSEV
jgi:signal transduction histidine kinase